jgi:hypothetical protein
MRLPVAWIKVAVVGAVVGSVVAEWGPARADVLLGAGGMGRELDHRVDVTLVDGLARLEVRRVFHNTGHRRGDLALAFRISQGAVVTDLGVDGPGRAAMRWAGRGLAVLDLPGMASGGTRAVTYTILAPLEDEPETTVLVLPDKRQDPALVTVQVFAKGIQAMPESTGEHNRYELLKKAPREAAARHAWLKAGPRGVLLSELRAPRYWTARVNESLAAIVLDLDSAGPTDSRATGFELVREYVKRFGQGRFLAVVPGATPRRLSAIFQGWRDFLETIEAEAQAPGKAIDGELGPAILAAFEALGTGPAPVRIVLITNRDDVPGGLVASSREILVGMPPGSVVNIAVLTPDPTSGRDDDHPLAPMALLHGGMLVRIGAGMNDDARRYALQFIRPRQLDLPAVVIDDQVVPLDTSVPESRFGIHVQVRDVPPTNLGWRGRVWADAWELPSLTEPAWGERVLMRAIWSNAWDDLTRDEAVDVSRRARVLTPCVRFESARSGFTQILDPVEGCGRQ